MYTAGHQLASHTWTHQDLSGTNATQRQNQMVYNEMAFRNIFGWFPTYMRPPFTSCSYASGCEDHMAALGYHMIYLDIDTKDYLNDSPDLIQKSKDYFSGNVSGNVASSSYLTLTHDTHFQTAINLTEFMLQTLQARGFRAVSVGECLGDPKVNWYRNATNGAALSSVSLSSSTASSSPSVAFIFPNSRFLVSFASL
jgi:peptidoglycan/xylan/chitin deacetylase (PgdA/CDA1 family)